MALYLRGVVTYWTHFFFKLKQSDYRLLHCEALLHCS